MNSTSSLGSILNIARSAIFAQQTGMRVVSQNIANAQSEGYSRRTIKFVETRSTAGANVQLGGGVRVMDVGRTRDALLDSTFRSEQGRAAGYELRHDILSRVEQVFGEPSENGLGSTLDAFWSAWSDLSNRPTDPSARRVVQQHGARVASALQTLDRGLDGLARDTRTQLNETVSQVNELSKQIGVLNKEIVVTESGGQEADDLRDQRDRVVDELAKLASVRVLDRGNGSIGVMVENATLVDGAEVRQLRAAGSPLQLEVVNGSALTFGSDRSKLGVLVQTLGTSGIQAVRDRLNELASSMVTQVNTLHESGHSPAGTTGVSFFDPSGVTAGTIALSDAVAGSASRVATSDQPGEQSNNRIALAIAGLRNRNGDNEALKQVLDSWGGADPRVGAINGAVLAGNRSFAEHYEDVVTSNALQTNLAERSAEVFRTITEQADSRRQSAMGVSTDEELVRLVQFQHAYTAATKLVTTVDEMVQAVLNMVR